MKAIQYLAYGGFADCSRTESSMFDRIQTTLALARKNLHTRLKR
jgi:hypothetical protein